MWEIRDFTTRADRNIHVQLARIHAGEWIKSLNSPCFGRSLVFMGSKRALYCYHTTVYVGLKTALTLSCGSAASGGHGGRSRCAQLVSSHTAPTYSTPLVYDISYHCMYHTLPDTPTPTRNVSWHDYVPTRLSMSQRLGDGGRVLISVGDCVALCAGCVVGLSPASGAYV